MNTSKLLQQYNDAWNERNFAIFAQIFADGVTYWDPFVAKPLPAGEMGAYAQQLLTAFPDLRFDVTFERSGADFGTFEWVMRGSNSGESALHPATSRPLALPGIDLITVEDGRIRAIKAYFDVREYARQLGLETLRIPSFS